MLTILHLLIDETDVAPVLTDDRVRNAVNRLRNGRGLGLDLWAPREFKALSDVAISHLADIVY